MTVYFDCISHVWSRQSHHFHARHKAFGHAGAGPDMTWASLDLLIACHDHHFSQQDSEVNVPFVVKPHLKLLGPGASFMACARVCACC